jgi:hypothetical protein
MERRVVTGHKPGSGQLAGFNDTRITCSFNYMIPDSCLPGSPGARPRGFAFPGQHGLGIRARPCPCLRIISGSAGLARGRRRAALPHGPHRLADPAQFTKGIGPHPRQA